VLLDGQGQEIDRHMGFLSAQAIRKRVAALGLPLDRALAPLMELVATLSQALSGAAVVAVLAAFAWGFASIWLSPCHLAGVPLVVG
jgi:hypothetical protein